MNDTNANTLEQLKQASAGLLMLSESDYPFEVFLWDAAANPDFKKSGDNDRAELQVLSDDELLQLTGHPEDTPIELVSLNFFFKSAINVGNPDDEEEKATVEKFRSLVEVLKSHLSDIKVYRLGEIEIDVYIVGLTQSGDWAGLSTKVVET